MIDDGGAHRSVMGTIVNRRMPADALQPTGSIAKAAPEDIAASFADETRRAYASDWKAWRLWCARTGMTPLPAEGQVLIAYLKALGASGRKMSTVGRHLAAIAHVHRLAGCPIDRADPALVFALKAMGRVYGTAKEGRAELLTADIAKMVRRCGQDRRGLRDRAMILLGFAAGLRRGELVDLQVNDIERRPAGLILTIRRSKGDQAGEGQRVGVQRGQRAGLCPVQALETWLDAAGIAEGPIFRPVTSRGDVVLPRALDGQTVWLTVKRLARRAGLDPERLGAHSLRVVHVTQALRNGADPLKAQRQMRHRKLETTLGYNRDAELMDGNTSGKLGL